MLRALEWDGGVAICDAGPDSGRLWFKPLPKALVLNVFCRIVSTVVWERLAGDGPDSISLLRRLRSGGKMSEVGKEMG